MTILGGTKKSNKKFETFLKRYLSIFEEKMIKSIGAKSSLGIRYIVNSWMKEMKRNDPPANWYLAINIPAGIAWGIVLPIILGVLLDWQWWVIIVFVIIWDIINARVIDKYIPVLTSPLVMFMYRLLKKNE